MLSKTAIEKINIHDYWLAKLDVLLIGCPKWTAKSHDERRVEAKRLMYMLLYNADVTYSCRHCTCGQQRLEGDFE